ncbi:MAG: diphosphomevalonate decarboxylase, partial [Enterococcus hulanensis]
MYSGKARAYTNIALIKYWGKENQELIIPMNNSLSLTLDAFYTETNVAFSEDTSEDLFYLDNQLQDSKATLKVSRFLDLVRAKAGSSLHAHVKSQNFVPTAAGLASSA